MNNLNEVSMNNLTIRKANIDDLIIIQNLNNELFKLEKNNFDTTLIDNWPLSDDGKKYFEELINNSYVIVATIDNQIVGYLAGTINEKGTYENVQYGEINNMYIDEKYRKYGIGKKFVNNFIGYCKDNNIFSLKVTASAKNVNAINFYKRLGFEDFDITLTNNIE